MITNLDTKISDQKVQIKTLFEKETKPSDFVKVFQLAWNLGGQCMLPIPAQKVKIYAYKDGKAHPFQSLYLAKNFSDLVEQIIENQAEIVEVRALNQDLLNYAESLALQYVLEQNQQHFSQLNEQMLKVIYDKAQNPAYSKVEFWEVLLEEIDYAKKLFENYLNVDS